MKLHEFHVPQFASSPKGHRVTIGSRNFGIGCFPVETTGSPRCQNRLLGPDECLAMTGIPDQGTATLPFMSQQINCERVLPDIDLWIIPDLFDQCPHDFLARGIAQSVYHTSVAVAPLLRESNLAIRLIKMGSHRNEFPDPGRGFSHDGFDDFLIA